MNKVIMRCCLLIFLLWLSTSSTIGQIPEPGGVKGAVHWYVTETGAASPGLRSRVPGNNNLISFSNATSSSLNFHPSLLLNGSNTIHVDLGSHDFRSASYFTVYQSLDTTAENNIWHIASNDRASLVLTTDRMADLSVYQYMNYRDIIRKQPKVNVYVQHKDDSVLATKQTWNIGVRPAIPALPIINFKGLIPEIIAYDRVLNSIERLQVASYLALKYGITLAEPGATYLNSSGNKIWDGYDYRQWHRNIAGICRDDASGLKQTIASSSNTPGLLTISSKNPLINNSFLLWGDNDKTLTPAPKIAGLPVLLQRTWLMIPSGNSQPFVTDVEIDTRPIDASLPQQPVYWLAIDPTGEGEFASPATRFIKMDQIDHNGKAFFKNVKWDTDGSGKDVWGIIAGQDLLLATIIDEPLCNSPYTGRLQVKVLGGVPPYQLSLQSNNGSSLNKYVSDNLSPIDLDGLSTGKYFLKVIDATHLVYTDSFYINNKDIPLPGLLADKYTIPPGRALEIDAAQAMPPGFSWEWKGPKNFQSFNPKVSITEPGLYTIRCTKNNCSSERDVLITETPANSLYDVTVFPNPSSSVYTAKIRLDKPAPVMLSVYTTEGKLVAVQKGEDRSNYLFTGELKSSGVYELVFTSGLSKTTRRLVIAK